MGADISQTAKILFPASVFNAFVQSEKLEQMLKPFRHSAILVWEKLNKQKSRISTSPTATKIVPSWRVQNSLTFGSVS